MPQATIASTMGSIFQTIFITTMNTTYGKLGVRLTDWENHRTGE